MFSLVSVTCAISKLSGLITQTELPYPWN